MPEDLSRDQKRLLRLSIKERLRSLSLDRFSEAGDEVARSLLALPQWQCARTVCAFLSMIGEIDTDRICRAALDSGKTLCLPRVQGEDINFYIGRLDQPWFLGAFGIREPLSDASRADFALVAGPILVLVPGLAFDSAGGRLGRGKGFYDRFLRSLRSRRTDVFAVGIGLGAQVVESVPVTESDERLDALLTD
ncbi:MAG: 5-formyltetrahydrofolate cyclo-ligase [Treponemataceae bacterium]